MGWRVATLPRVVLGHCFRHLRLLLTRCCIYLFGVGGFVDADNHLSSRFWGFPGRSLDADDHLIHWGGVKDSTCTTRTEDGTRHGYGWVDGLPSRIGEICATFPMEGIGGSTAKGVRRRNGLVRISLAPGDCSNPRCACGRLSLDRLNRPNARGFYPLKPVPHPILSSRMMSPAVTGRQHVGTFRSYMVQLLSNCM